jgi:hypothetical protein
VIDALASAPHYVDHVSAVFGALPESVRGDLLIPQPSKGRLRAYEPNHPERPVLVASFGDLKRAVRLGRRRIAMMEHGAGQSYGGRHAPAGQHGSYAGGRGRGPSSLFLHPGEHPAERDRRAYPQSRVEVVGSPFLDTLPHRVGERGRVVAFSFHFNGGVAPETKNAFSWAFPAIMALRDRYEMIGHAHPRLYPNVEATYRHLGIEPVEDFRDVCRRADVYVCDNSSTLFAFAATGRPVVVLNPPWYDRSVDHGLRFWDAATVGVQCDRAERLAESIDEALRDEPSRQRDREAALDLVYAFRSGAAKRAASVLEDWAHG